MAAPTQIIELVERFDRNRDSYTNTRYNETQNRREFLDPLFKALGWDMDNTAGYAEAYKDVVHEDALKINESTKAPDYSFRVGGTRKFFLEAKKPSINIGEAADPAYQLRRYAWSAKLQLSVLSNFAELAIYDCTVRPQQGDKSSNSRVKFYTCDRKLPRQVDSSKLEFPPRAIVRGSVLVAGFPARRAV